MRTLSKAGGYSREIRNPDSGKLVLGSYACMGNHENWYSEPLCYFTRFGENMK
jgi:hypothetical protein